jgi:pyruvate/2-oxoglutarate dehydrogenase complex dihydrolipoamide dehydrogenase (E3) component
MNSSITNPDEYDLVVLGSGEAGKYIAWTMAQQGQHVALIERKYIGGSCPNIACLPSKNFIHSAKVASYFWRSEEFGIAKEHVKITMAGVRARKRQMVDDLITLGLGKFKSSGATLVMGSGHFIAPRTLEVTEPDGGTRVLRGKRVVISTGSRATVEPIPGLDQAKPLTHIELLELDQVPEHLLIIGGGYVGLEFAQAMRRLGSRVTIIERNDRLAHREDNDVSDLLQELFRQEGIEIATSTHVTQVEGKSGERLKLHASQGDSRVTLEGTHILIAGGRTPNTAGLGLELAGVELTDRDFVKVNERLETSASDVFAVGDCAGSPHFTHIAFDDYRILRDNFAGGHRVTTGRQVPSCMFTDPELARVGLSESEAKAQGVRYKLLKLPMSAVPRARTVSEMEGFMKALVDPDSDRILGFTALGVGAGEIMAVVQVAMAADLPYKKLSEVIFTHPTLPEGLVFLFTGVAAKS